MAAEHSFFSLTPDRILDAVENGLDSVARGVRATGRAMALNSIENRVYEVELDDNSSVVTKFYRPGRWTVDQILEEHDFIQRLSKAEVPVVAPLPLKDAVNPQKPTLARSSDGILFAVFPKMRGRLLDELREDQLQVLGRFLARLHAVGASMPKSLSQNPGASVARSSDTAYSSSLASRSRGFGIGSKSRRLCLDVRTYGRDSLDFLLKCPTPPGARYRQLVETILNQIEPRFEGVAMSLIHGDCHLGNVLWNEVGPFFVDFDDMLVGPAVQDIWMIVRGDDDEAARARDTLINAYEEFRDFDRSTLDLIEPLRALRIIHYSAWIARRWEDPSFHRMFPSFGTEKWWEGEIEALYRVLHSINPGL